MTQLGHGHNAERAFPAALLDLLLCHNFSIPPAVRHAWSWSMRVVAETAICECLQQAGRTTVEVAMAPLKGQNRSAVAQLLSTHCRFLRRCFNLLCFLLPYASFSRMLRPCRIACSITAPTASSDQCTSARVWPAHTGRKGLAKKVMTSLPELYLVRQSPHLGLQAACCPG